MDIRETAQLSQVGTTGLRTRCSPNSQSLPGDVTIRVLPGDKIYQAMEIEPEFMRPAILHGFGTSAKKRLPVRLAELAQYGWMPLAAALFGTVKWRPQWLHHNFPPSHWIASPCQGTASSLTDRQLLEQAAQLDFGLPTVFDALGTWHTEINGYTFDIHCALPNKYTPARQPVTLRYCLIAFASGHSGFFAGRSLARRCPYARSTTHDAL